MLTKLKWDENYMDVAWQSCFLKAGLSKSLLRVLALERGATTKTKTSGCYDSNKGYIWGFTLIYSLLKITGMEISFIS